MEFGGAADRKRGRAEPNLNGNGNFKKFKQETESFPTGIGSKSKPCTKFFSTSGCPFGDGCHFSHYVPGGYKAVAQMTNLNIGSNLDIPPGRSMGGPPSFPKSSSPPATKSRLCTKYNTVEGCNFGDKCRFAHGEWELGKPTSQSYEDPRVTGYTGGRMDMGRQNRGTATAGFGASAAAKISVDASLVGAIIGKGGANSKNICRVTGAKLAVRDSDVPNQKNIELEGTIDQISQASTMVQELISNVGSGYGPPMQNRGSAYSPSMSKLGSFNEPSLNNPRSAYGGRPPRNLGSAYGPPMGNPGMSFSSGAGGNLKRKLCENFAKGSCKFGEGCHFAHGTNELRKPGM